MTMKNPFEMFANQPPDRRNDEKEARRWRGPVFANFYHIGDKSIPRPHAVTFPICCGCHHVIWDWPHFQEDVPVEACCTACADEAMNDD